MGDFTRKSDAFLLLKWFWADFAPKYLCHRGLDKVAQMLINRPFAI